MFFGFNTAVRGLSASQRALYTTNHNIDNMSTPGYSRQQVEQSASTAHRLPGIGYIGTGTEIRSINRVRDSFVDYKYWNGNAPNGEWNIKNDSLNQLEKVMGEPTDSSFRQYLDDFYQSLDELSKNVNDPAFREPVRENARSFTRHINEIGSKLHGQKEETVINLNNKVGQINQMSSQIASLNRQIYLQENGGKNANDLRDRRELVVDQLSEIVNIRVTEENDRYDVSIGGNSLVNHINHSEIKLNRNELEGKNKDGTEKVGEDKGTIDPENVILWENGSPVNYRSGELKGLVDIITGDGKNNSYRGIPFYENQLNEFARNFTEKVNEQHRKGFNLKGEQEIDFFTIDDEENPALTLRLSNAILESVDNIAAGGTSGSAEDNRNLLELIEMREDRKFFDEKKVDGESFPIGTPDDFIKSMLSSLAVDTLQTVRFKETQGLMQKNLANKRESISGVSLNDEMGDMVKFQRVYVAASKMVTTYDTLLDVTINRLGLVGR